MQKQIVLEYCQRLNCEGCTKIIVHLHNPLLTVDGLGMFTSIILSETFIEGNWVYVVQYDDEILVDPNNPLNACDIKTTCCHGCIAEYIDKLNSSKVFTVVGNTGSIQTIDSGDLLSLLGQGLISVVSMNTDTLQISLASGTDGQVLGTVGSTIQWITPSSITCEFVQDCVGTTVAPERGLSYNDSLNTLSVVVDPTGGIELTPTGLAIDCAKVQECETVTSLVNNGDGTFTFINEIGTSITIPFFDGVATLSQLPNGDYNFVDELGTVTLIDNGVISVSGNIVNNTDPKNPIVNESVTAITNTVVGNKIADFTNENGAIVPINETITSLDYIGGDLHYTRESGDTQIINLPSSPGETATIITNTVAGHKIADYTNELAVVYPINEVVTTITNTVAGVKIADYTNEGGTVTAINETNTSLSNVGNVLSYTRESGAVQTVILPNDINTTITNTVAGHKIADYTNEAGTVYPINEVNTTITNTVAGVKIADYTNESGTVTAINQTNTSLTYTSNQLTYTRESGATQVITLPNDAFASIGANAAGGTNFRHTSTVGTNVTIPAGFDTLNTTDPCLGIGASNALRQFSLSGTTLTIRSAPEHTALNAQGAVNFGSAGPFVPSGTPYDIGTPVTVGITNPSLCRSMLVLIIRAYYHEFSLTPTANLVVQVEESINGGAYALTNTARWIADTAIVRGVHGQPLTTTGVIIAAGASYSVALRTKFLVTTSNVSSHGGGYSLTLVGITQ